MSGLVTFTDLSTSGSTNINGANITTGTISADRLDTSTLKVEEIYGRDANGDTDVVVFKTDTNELSIGHYVGTSTPAIYSPYPMTFYSSTYYFKSPFSDQLHYIEFDTHNRHAHFDGWRLYLGSSDYLDASGGHLYWNGTRLD